MDSDKNSAPSPPPPIEPPPALPPPLPARPKKTSLPAFPIKEDEVSASLEQDLLDNEDEISQHMTQSYSEISFKSGNSPEDDLSPALLNMDCADIGEQFKQRPATLSCDQSNSHINPLTMEGTVHVEGKMTHFVTEDLEYKIKISSPVSKKETPSGSRSGTPSTLYRQLLLPQIGQLDATLINELEVEAHRMATSIDSLIENLSSILHSISSITADNVDVYENAVSKMSDAMDSNIKSMYTMMAKTEEVTQNMKEVEGYAVRIKEIKKLVDLFESFL